MMMRSFNSRAIAGLAMIALSLATAGFSERSRAATIPPAPSTNAPPPTKTIAPAQPSLPPVPAEVVRMSEAGVSDDLIISYIQKSDTPYSLSADQIVYLHDVGISSAVLKALVDRSGADFSSQTAPTSDQMAAPGGSSSTASVAAPAANPPVSGPAANYYYALAPYGTWIYVAPYGWCWQPSAAAVNPGWQPYCDNGSWLWTDQGWYWNSYYSWGWAPFHYGRWCRYSGYGWIWCPDDVWGPAWVCWRDYPGYCGWAPLPPGAYFSVGVGWTYYGAAVGVNFGFWLAPYYFTFCDYDHFCHRHPYHYFHHGHDADRFYHHSRVHNDFAVDSHHRFVNRGIAPSRIESATHTRIREVAVREMPRGAAGSRDFAMPDRLTRSGGSPVIYRPGRDLATMRNRFQPGNDTRWTARRSDSVTARNFADRRAFDGTSRFQAGRSDNQMRSLPASPANRSYGNAFNRSPGTAGNSPVVRSMPQNNRSPGYSYSRPSSPPMRAAPAWRSAPTWRSEPAWRSAPAPTWRSAPARPSSPSFSRPAPSFGGGRSGGGASFGGGARSGGGGHFGGGGGGRTGGGFHR